ncbi:hypothetical protein ONE63_007374 [Megalurothrips usitatus]|uniref:G patch domain-containing protein 11 n=1 Tax=Megalurothrips usitatus TaxID=439358 RepID=A0AAV7XNL5_9NEOP|nr:hypothetical protein ONE63_007374 [Megalurothrips usitatus]
MSSDEDDYMSAAFVVDSPAKDIRPGLIHNRQQQRSHDIKKQKELRDAQTREQQRPVKVIEAERREEGLKEALGADNKGFALLQKMGYKPGTGIGKSGSGTVDPIPLHLKSDRQGLGRAAAIEELKQAKRMIRAKKQQSAKSEEVSVEQFRARLKQKSDQRLLEIDLFKSQKACHQLDVDGGYTEPAEPWFWPKQKTPEKSDDQDTKEKCDETSHGEKSSRVQPDGSESEDEKEEEEDEFEVSEKMEMLTKYLRSTYCYCIWCCVKFDDDKDMQNECPGPSRDDH